MDFTNDEIVQYGKRYEQIGQASRSSLVEKPDMQIEVSSLTVDEDTIKKTTEKKDDQE